MVGGSELWLNGYEAVVPIEVEIVEELEEDRGRCFKVFGYKYRWLPSSCFADFIQEDQRLNTKQSVTFVY